MSELRQKMVKEMELRNFAPSTQRAYLNAVAGLSGYYKKAPDKITKDEIEDYLIYLKNDRKLAFNTRNVAASGFKFFYNETLKSESVYVDLSRRQKSTHLPVVLNR